MANFRDHLRFKFQYLFSIMISCLILRVAVILQFNQSIGPLIKIVGKMANDFQNFLVLYAILTIMFSIVGNMNFILYLPEYSSLFMSVETVIDASLGNFKFSMFDAIKGDDFLKNMGHLTKS